MSELVERLRWCWSEGSIGCRRISENTLGPPSLDVTDRSGEDFDIRIGESAGDGESVEMVRDPSGLRADEVGQFLISRLRGVVDELAGHDLGHEAVSFPARLDQSGEVVAPLGARSAPGSRKRGRSDAASQFAAFSVGD